MQPGLQREIQDSYNCYIGKPALKTERGSGRGKREEGDREKERRREGKGERGRKRENREIQVSKFQT